MSDTPITETAARIFHVVRSVPAGCVSTYGDVARLAGLPGRARYVGTLLSRLPTGSRLPWFRVINSQGRISFPEQSPLWLEQTSRLQAEGVSVREGRVDLRQYRWCP